MPGGIMSPFGLSQTMQLQNHVNDIERSMMYGLPQAPGGTNTAPITPTMAGLRSILTTNFTATPTNANAYGSTDLVRDLLTSCRQNGGDPNLIFVATNFMTGFATWGHAVQRCPPAQTVFGTPIKIIKAPFLDDITIVKAPLLHRSARSRSTRRKCIPAGSGISFWNQRGNRGDMLEGEWLSETAIQVENQFHHAWVEGITAFAAN